MQTTSRFDVKCFAKIRNNELIRVQFFRAKLCRVGNSPQARGYRMSKLVLRFVKNESGATAIEYGLIAAGIAVAIIATVQALGTNLNSTFSTVSTALK